MSKKPIEPGDKYGKLTAIRFHSKGKRWRKNWLFKCECGAMHVADMTNVKGGRTKSCGCIHRKSLSDRATHGLSKHPIYSVWDNMQRRCNDPKNPGYKNYGARGITVCDRWLDVANFIADMAPRPSKKHSIERIDNNKGYSPENCVWALRAQQARNRRSNRYYEYNGKRLTVMDWSNETGIHFQTLLSRLNMGWGIEKAITHPIQVQNR